MKLVSVGFTKKGLNVTTCVTCEECFSPYVDLMRENGDGVYLICKTCKHTMILEVSDAEEHLERSRRWRDEGI